MVTETNMLARLSPRYWISRFARRVSTEVSRSTSKQIEELKRLLGKEITAYLGRQFSTELHELRSHLRTEIAEHLNNHLALQLRKEARRLAREQRHGGGLGWYRLPMVLPSPDIIIDVGSGTGTVELYKAFPRAVCYAIDPLEEHRTSLETLAEKYNLRILITAVGSEKCTKTFNILQKKVLTGSSFLQRIGYMSDVPVEQREIPVERLDALFSSQEGRFGLKIDVEGFETEVIRGASGILDRIDWVITEVSFTRRFIDDPMFDGVYEMMKQNGFVFIDQLEVTREENGSLRRVDLIFKKANG